MAKNLAIRGAPVSSSSPSLASREISVTGPRRNLAVMGRPLRVPPTPTAYSSPPKAPAPPSTASHSTDGMTPSSLRVDSSMIPRSQLQVVSHGSAKKPRNSICYCG